MTAALSGRGFQPAPPGHRNRLIVRQPTCMWSSFGCGAWCRLS